MIQRLKSRVPQRFGAEEQSAQFARLTHAESTSAAAVHRHSCADPVGCRTNRSQARKTRSSPRGLSKRRRCLASGSRELGCVGRGSDERYGYGCGASQSTTAKQMLHVEHRSPAQKETRHCRVSHNHSVPRGTCTSQVTDAAASPRDVTSHCWPHGPGQRSSNRAAGSRRARRAVRTTHPAGSSR